MRRPQATTVSAPSTKAPASRAAAARAFSSASRTACAAGVSSACGVSSTAAGTTASGARSICASSAARRGDAEASTRRGLVTRGGLTPRLLEAEGDPALGQVVRRHLDIDPIAGEDTDAVLAHLARRMREDDVVVVELDPEHRVGQELGHRSGELNQLFFRHSLTAVEWATNILSRPVPVKLFPAKPPPPRRFRDFCGAPATSRKPSGCAGHRAA